MYAASGLTFGNIREKFVYIMRGSVTSNKAMAHKCARKLVASYPLTAASGSFRENYILNTNNLLTDRPTVFGKMSEMFCYLNFHHKKYCV